MPPRSIIERVVLALLVLVLGPDALDGGLLFGGVLALGAGLELLGCRRARQALQEAPPESSTDTLDS